ncbi:MULTISPECIES: alpha/beta fold hydrolase [Kordiimonas]|jgi:pimeloyl-ACP methyl ester carboxylesterase|uniref:alpha/beta fold hydrolase n=1 Tax=Kordiimonas TaxID=288021 RepID=UPI00257F4679|nr:alpha/beta hydrolase [Kordiimonas sp. UBA4487]
MRVRRLLGSKKFWCCLVLLPFLLIGCASAYISMQPRFDHDEFAWRRSVATMAGQMYQLSYLEGGDPTGQRVIFVHGTPGDASNWYDMLKHAPKGYQFIAVDRPGFGQTRPENAQPSIMEQARALGPLITVPERGKPILVGHSLGGPVAAAAATLYGDQLGGVIIAAGALDPDLEEVMWVQHLGATPPVSWLLQWEFRNANFELIALEDELRALAPRLRDIHIPVTIVHGTADELVPYANTDYMMREFSGTAPKLVTLEGGNHFLPWNARGPLLDAITEMASKLPATRLVPVQSR